MTKQINTGVAELLLYRVPRGQEDYYDFTLTETGTIYGINNITHEQMQVSCDINLTNFELLGIAHELTEEVWHTLVQKVAAGWYENYTMNQPTPHPFSTATESGLSLLRANECYAVNPYKIGGRDPLGESSQIDPEYESYLKAQQNTGKWIALKPIKLM